MEMTLYAAPGTCARVAMTALEEVGLPYRVELVRFMRGEHLSPEHRARNPLGKVPSLTVDGHNLRENVAILNWLHESHPEAHLLPLATDSFARAEQLADLCFCSSTLHPIVTRIALPMMFGPADATVDIRARAEAMMQRFFAVIEARLDGRDYWYGAEWSVMDAYIAWVHARVTGVGFDAGLFPRLEAAMARHAARPSARAVAAREAEMSAQLQREGAELNGGNVAAVIASNEAPRAR